MSLFARHHSSIDLAQSPFAESPFALRAFAANPLKTGKLLGCFLVLLVVSIVGVVNPRFVMAQDLQGEFKVLQTTPQEGGFVSDERPPVRFTFSEPLDPASISDAAMLVIGTRSGLRTTQQCEQLDDITLQCTPTTSLIGGETLQIQLRPTLRSLQGENMTQPLILNFVASPLLTGAEPLSTLSRGWSPTEVSQPNLMSTFPDIPQLGIQGEEIELLANKAESLLFDRMGFQEFGYASVKKGSARATELRAGWQMNERTQLWFVQEVRSAYPSNRFVLEFDMNKNLDVLLTQGDQRWQGVDLRWKKEY